jgi:hypothetical protein
MESMTADVCDAGADEVMAPWCPSDKNQIPWEAAAAWE